MGSKLSGVSTRFQKGNPGKPKGAIATKSIAKAAISTIGTIEQVKLAMQNDGLTDLYTSLRRLKLRDRVNAYLALMEYCYPKLGRIEMTVENKNEVIQVFGKLLDNDIQDAEIIDTNNTTE